MLTFPLRISRVLCGWVLACVVLPAAASDYAVIQQLSAVASGQGEPDGLFGWSVAVDGDLAVAADLRLSGLAAHVRTYARSGTNWVYQAGQDIEIPGDSGAMLSFNDGTLALTAYRSAAPSRGYFQIYRHNGENWNMEASISSTVAYYDAVATNDQIAVAGEWSYDGDAGANQGRVRIMRRQSNGNWSSQALLPTTPQAGALFGTSVAIVAGAIVVGAPFETVTDGGGPHTRAGAAYVYELTIDTWNEVARLVEAPGVSLSGNRFGSAVAISGADASTPDRILVARASSESEGRAGIVRGYRREAGTWTPGLTISAPTPSTSDQFGCSLAMDGEWALIGQCAGDSAGADAGAVLVARFNSGFESVVSLSERTDPQAGAGEFLGVRVAIDRDGPTAMVGNLSADLYGNEEQGVVLIGRSPNGTSAPSLARAIDLGQGLDGARAAVVAVDGDTLMLGALNEDVGVQAQRGAVYVYRRQGDGRYAFESRLLAPDGTANDQFGSVIALKGDAVLISATGRSHMGEDQAGSVYAFHRDGLAWTLDAQFLPPNPGHETRLGFSLAFDGDTAFLGEIGDNTTVLEYSGNGVWTTVQSIPTRALAVQVQGDIALLGDREADGHLGEVAIYTRDAGVWQPGGTLSGSDAEQRFGSEIALDGGLVAVTSASPAASVQIFQRNGSTWLPQASLLPDDTASTTHCSGVALREATLAVSCLDGSTGNHGAVYVYEKIAGLWGPPQKLTLPDPVELDVFGFDLAWTDQGSLLASSFGREVDFLDQGAVYVYRGDVLFQNGFE